MVTTIVVNETSLGYDDWWLPCGCLPADCETAYAPKGASSGADSYINLANPGTNNASPGTAPDWDATNGWKFDAASSQYLRTGLAPVQGWSAICKFSNVSDQWCLFGCARSDTVNHEGIYVYPNYTSGSALFYKYGITLPAGQVVPVATSGVVAITQNGGYRDGTFEVALSSISEGLPKLLIGALAWDIADGETPTDYITGYIQAFALYNKVLSQEQIQEIIGNMP